MSIFGGNALGGSTPLSGTATSGVLEPNDLVNAPAGNVIAQERYPGSVDPQEYEWGYLPGTEKSAAGPLDLGEDPFSSTLPAIAQDGGYQDLSWATGHEGTGNADWDSSAGPPFAPSGAIPQWVHDDDGTGATFLKYHVPGADIGSLTRTTMTGQTYNREFRFDPVTGQNVPAPNGRTGLDQQQWHDPNPVDGFGYPLPVEYAERVMYGNLAFEAQPIMPENSIYTPSGQLPDRSQFSYAAEAYGAPEDPSVASSTPQASSVPGSEWVM